MSDPADVVQGIFTTLVVAFVLIVIWGAFQGWNVSSIIDLATSAAVPVFFLLLALFFILQISNL